MMKKKSSKTVAAKKKPTKPAPKKAAAKKSAPKKVAAKKPAPKKPSAKKPAPKKAAAKKPAKVAKPAKPGKPAKPAVKPAKPAAKAPAKKPAEAKKGKLEPELKGKRGRKPKNAGAVTGDLDEPNAEALAAAEAEVIHEEAPKKPKPRRRRSRQMPRVPVELRSKPAWAEAWTTLAETGSDIDTIKRILQYASRLFIGLGELSPKNTEELLRFFEVNEAPAGVESILEEAFLSQPPQAERKSALEAFFKDALKNGSIADALNVLILAGHQGDWREATKQLRVVGSPHSENAELYLLAREAVG